MSTTLYFFPIYSIFLELSVFIILWNIMVGSLSIYILAWNYVHSVELSSYQIRMISGFPIIQKHADSASDTLR